jgi:hypothetical protein
MTRNIKVRNEHNDIRLGIFFFSISVLALLCIMGVMN